MNKIQPEHCSTAPAQELYPLCCGPWQLAAPQTYLYRRQPRQNYCTSVPARTVEGLELSQIRYGDETAWTRPLSQSTLLGASTMNQFWGLRNWGLHACTSKIFHMQHMLQGLASTMHIKTVYMKCVKCEECRTLEKRPVLKKAIQFFTSLNALIFYKM